MKHKLKIPGIWLQDTTGVVRIDQEKIAYCHHFNDITRIVYSGGQAACAQVPLKRMEDKLCRRKFFRCHRNYLVNLDYAVAFSPDEALFMVDGKKKVPVSRRRLNELKHKITHMASNSNPPKNNANH